jgi:pimeloyl-ACP methyl ester carboxylesterase
MDISTIDRISAFERDRLSLFERHGFAAETKWFTDATGRRTAAVVGGEGDKTTVLVHGFMMQAGEWALVAGALSGRVVIPDWPGCGLSDPIDYRKTNPREFGRVWLSGLIQTLGTESVDIVGSSVGGYLALSLALATPSVVRRIVTVGSHPGYVRSVPAIIRLFATPGVGSLLMRQQPKDAEANRKQVFSHLSANPSAIPVDMLDSDLAASALPNAVAAASDFVRTLVSPISGLRSNLLIHDVITSLDVPALYLWGTKDNFMRPQRVRHILEHAPNVQMRTLEGAGHVLTLEQPTAVVEAANSFFQAA